MFKKISLSDFQSLANTITQARDAIKAQVKGNTALQQIKQQQIKEQTAPIVNAVKEVGKTINAPPVPTSQAIVTTAPSIPPSKTGVRIPGRSPPKRSISQGSKLEQVQKYLWSHRLKLNKPSTTLRYNELDVNKPLIGPKDNPSFVDISRFNEGLIIFQGTEIYAPDILMNLLILSDHAMFQQLNESNKQEIVNYLAIVSRSGISTKSLNSSKKMKLLKGIIGTDTWTRIFTTQRPGSPVIQEGEAQGEAEGGEGEGGDGGIEEEKEGQQGNGVMIISSPEQAIDKLQILIGTRQAGNRSKRVHNDIQAICDYLHSHKHISKAQHKKLCA